MITSRGGHVGEFNEPETEERYWKREWNGKFQSRRSNRSKWTTSRGGSLGPVIFRLVRTVPLNFQPNFPEILA